MQIRTKQYIDVCKWVNNQFSLSGHLSPVYKLVTVPLKNGHFKLVPVVLTDSVISL